MRISNGRICEPTIEVGPASYQRSNCGRVQSIRRTAVSGVQLCLTILFLGQLSWSSAQVQRTFEQDIRSPERAHAQVCPDPPPQTSGSHGFRRAGETIDIPISIADCQPISFVVRWSNGRNNGSFLVVTFLDSLNQPIASRSLSSFQTGSFEFPFASLDSQPWFARGSVVSMPATVVIQALAPFAAPANISYTVTRGGAVARSRPRAPAQPAIMGNPGSASAKASLLDDQVAMRLRTSEGRLLAQGQGSGSAESIRYKLKELALPEAKEIELNGRREKLEFAYRLTLARGEVRGSQQAGQGHPPSLSKFGLIWLDDAALPAFSLDSQEISTLIYDRSILRDGAEISVSNSDGSDMYSLERLTLAPNVEGSKSVQSRHGEEGNEIVGIRSAVRVIGVTRIPLVQIELKTNRPFPPRDSALQLQIGRRFFLSELTGDYTGRTLMLTLTQEMFAELKQDAEIVAFFGKPDRSGFTGRDVWHFGRLDKSRLR
jgi:hypothetical protein